MFYVGRPRHPTLSGTPLEKEALDLGRRYTEAEERDHLVNAARQRQQAGVDIIVQFTAETSVDADAPTTDAPGEPRTRFNFALHHPEQEELSVRCYTHESGGVGLNVHVLLPHMVGGMSIDI